MEFSKAEERFLAKNEFGRLATISPDGMRHVVPVSYMYEDGSFWVAVDCDTKKYRNLQSKRKAPLVIDVVNPSRGILIQGEAEIFERGPEFKHTYPTFYRKFGWVRASPWKEGEAPFIRIMPTKKAGWGIK